jgi:hypothetical protein
MNLRNAKKLIKQVYQTQIKTGNRYAIHLISGPGIGKSSIVKQLAQELGKEMKTPFANLEFFLNSKEAPDVGGYGLPDDDVDGSKIMVWTRAPWMPRADDPQHGFVFLDEFRQSQHDVQKVSAELLLNGKVNASELPITYMVLAASNREGDRSGVGRELAFVTNRTMELYIEPDLESWVEWAEKRGVHWGAIAFAKRRPGLIFKDKVPEQSGPFCSPRSFVAASHLMDTIDPDLFCEAAGGLIGEGTAAEFIAFMRVVDELPEYGDIVKDPKGCKLPSIDRPDALYACMQMVAHSVDVNTATEAFKYIQRMPKEFQIAGLRAALRKSPQILSSKDFAVWCRENQELIKATDMLAN